MMKRQLLTACAVPAFVLALAHPAHAQDAPAAAPTEAAEAATQDEDPSQDISRDIVITAQGRAQALADVPIAVSAISGENLLLSGANDIRQLNQLAPSLLVSSTGSEANGSARIRGIGTVGDNPGLESSVVTFIDGVYRSRSGIGLNELGEIDRIEVLRGPQGTLGGRNSSAGLISIHSKKPEFTLSGSGEANYGNYDFVRLAGTITGPISQTVAARLDGVFVQRDGFYNDPANNTQINDRDRYFVRGQLLYQPTTDIDVRLIGDYSKRDENCCAATYVDRSVNQSIGNLNNPATPLTTGLPNGNNIINVLTALGQNPAAFNQGYSRNVSVTPGRDYSSGSEDWGISGQIDWRFGDISLTSITAYRTYYNAQGSDTDYGTPDLLYNAGGDGNSRLFKTFTQELRLQGSLFDDKLDWLVGGFFLDEKIRVNSNLRFGTQYGRFAACRIVSGGGLAGLYSPTGTGCLSPTGRAVIGGQVPGAPSPFGAAGPTVLAAFDRLDGISDRGSIVDVYRQDTRSFAAFTHNIVHVTDTVDLTLGLRYTDERKRFSADFTNDNTACVANQQALTPFLANPGLAPIAGAILGLSCQGNSTSELNGVSINDQRNESEFTGTAVLSWKATEDLLLYGSYTRGYKAGGFNLDRSSLKLPIQTLASLGGAQALVGNLQFDPETVNSYEIGAKYATGPFTLAVAAFRQEFKNFQLNTFDGTVFIVENVNGCTESLNGGDRDQSKFAAAPNFSPTASATGACGAGNLGYGVLAQGVELEAQMVPIRDLRIAAGLTYADTTFRDNLVGNDSGAPLNQALRKLPGQNLSNAPQIVATSSVAWTPDLGSSGLSGLFYIDGRLTDDFNTGSDLFPQKMQDSFLLVNARFGVRGPDQRWAVEIWAQNLLDQDNAQVAFNSPFQEGATTAAFQDPQYPGGRQIFSQFLAEPRTYGLTLRGSF
ncbi:TonB-dependent receptor [Sphingomonas sp. 37zxx]|uniref:TonB-dependent receptor n=1 Tax=Sphingomonas sp. 37zxx TaxID=1550073 RepID=UPI00053BE2AF|nr:TonB-dependent receptor [Sphingomonas sp. 37zxx]